MNQSLLVVVMLVGFFVARVPDQSALAEDDGEIIGFAPGPQRDDIAPGEFIIDPPTLKNLGFRWYVEGDSNLNATVEVSFREKGREEWREALPMLRIHHEIVDRNRNSFHTGNLFAGSVLFLEPDTEYEVRFVMSDPDGGAPEEPKIVTVATRLEPQVYEDGRELHVYPPNFEGERSDDDAYDDLIQAYQAAKPGDVILLHPGIHPADDAPYRLTRSGEEGRPIVFRGSGDGEAVIRD